MFTATPETPQTERASAFETNQTDEEHGEKGQISFCSRSEHFRTSLTTAAANAARTHDRHPRATTRGDVTDARRSFSRTHAQPAEQWRPPSVVAATGVEAVVAIKWGGSRSATYRHTSPTQTARPGRGKGPRGPSFLHSSLPVVFTQPRTDKQLVSQINNARPLSLTVTSSASATERKATESCAPRRTSSSRIFKQTSAIKTNECDAEGQPFTLLSAVHRGVCGETAFAFRRHRDPSERVRECS